MNECSRHSHAVLTIAVERRVKGGDGTVNVSLLVWPVSVSVATVSGSAASMATVVEVIVSTVIAVGPNGMYRTHFRHNS